MLNSVPSHPMANPESSETQYVMRITPLSKASMKPTSAASIYPIIPDCQFGRLIPFSKKSTVKSKSFLPSPICAPTLENGNAKPLTHLQHIFEAHNVIYTLGERGGLVVMVLEYQVGFETGLSAIHSPIYRYALNSVPQNVRILLIYHTP